MQATFLSRRRVDFTDDATGKKIAGYNYYFSCDTVAPGWEGPEILKKFVIDGNPVADQPIPSGTPCIIEFNRYGKISQIVTP